MAELLTAGSEIAGADPIGPIGTDSFEMCGFWVAHLSLFLSTDNARTLETCRGLEPFEYQLHATKQLWHALPEGEDRDKVAAAGAEMIQQHSRSATGGLALVELQGDAFRVAIWMWLLWDPLSGIEGVREDLRGALSNRGLCHVLRGFANRLTIGGESQFSFYGGVGQVPTDPLPWITPEVLAAISQTYPEAQPASRLPSPDGDVECLSLAREYMLIAPLDG